MITFTYTWNLGSYISKSMCMESTYIGCNIRNKAKNVIRKNYSEYTSHLPKARFIKFILKYTSQEKAGQQADR